MRVRTKIPKANGRVALRTLELALWLIGIASLAGFVLLQLDQYWGQAALREEFAKSERRVEAPKIDQLPQELPGEPQPEPSETKPGTSAEQPPPLGAALGRLTAKQIGLDVMIAEGVDAATLRRAAGRIPGTARLDANGNVGVAAHRDTFFRPLREIRKGDVLEVETHQGRYRYSVEWTAVVDPSNVDSLQPSDDPELTLVTCFPFQYVGLAPRRFIVRAKRVEGPAEIASATQPEAGE